MSNIQENFYPMCACINYLGAHTKLIITKLTKQIFSNLSNNKTYHHKTYQTTKLINLKNISNSKLIKITTKFIFLNIFKRCTTETWLRIYIYKSFFICKKAGNIEMCSTGRSPGSCPCSLCTCCTAGFHHP